MQTRRKPKSADLGKTFSNHGSSRGSLVSADVATPDDPHTKEGNTKALAAIFVFAIILLIIVFSSFPHLSEEEWSKFHWPPHSLADLRELSSLLLTYRDQHLLAVISAFCTIYLFLQAFAIPGAIFLSILAGPLFGREFGLGLVSVIAPLGSCMCYLLSYHLGRGLVQRSFPQLLAKFRNQIQQHKHNLFFYLLFLRVSPILPNWFISISSPILNIPLLQFFGATFFGLIPANYLHVTTGLALGELQSSDSVSGITVNKRALATLFGIAILTLIPTLFRKKFEQVDASMAMQTKPEQSDRTSNGNPRRRNTHD